MALRDTLKGVKEQSRADAEFEARKPQLIKEWQAVVLHLNSEIKQWLADLEKDGSIQFAHDMVDIREELLGLYSAQAMNIHAGPIIVRVQPTARMILGGLGRVDMYRQGRSARDERVMFIRQKSEDGEGWMLRSPLRQGSHPRDLQRLDQQSFEAALDEMLK